MRHDSKNRIPANLEEYLFGDLELPRELPTLTHLTTNLITRRRLRIDAQPLVLPQAAQR
ncbi:MAG: hypothetical protein IT381_32905 [Deltaproteobacteria bacterium]|nr:hypothetical protein [Deltaproteobacteria bacterium]